MTVVDPPAGLGDPGAELAVAEVARVAGGCLLVEYVSLDGRTVNAVRDLLASEPTVHAVGAPVRGLSLEHDDTAHAAHGVIHHDDGGPELWHLPQPTMRNLWDDWEADSPVTVAVLDTGVDATHPDLIGRITSGGQTRCHGVDSHSHGTHVAGIIAAREGNDALFAGTAGVAPDAAILPVRVLKAAGCEPGMTATAAVAVAVNAGARVINMSFKWRLCERATTTIGGLLVDPMDECDPEQYDSGDADDSFELALRAASMLGVVAVTSVGNDGNDADDSGPPNQQNGPAVYPDVISVASINEDGQRSSFSTANSLVDIAAPGGKILSSVPLLTCEVDDKDSDGNDEWTPLGCGTDDPPTECTTTTNLRDYVEDTPQSCAHRIAHKSGTSMASPFVAGVVAHMLNRYPQATVDAGGSHTCAIKSSHHLDPSGPGVVCWGDDARGQADPLGGEFTQVSAGWLHSCGRRPDATVRCWGANTSGQSARARLKDLQLTPDGGTDLIRFDPDVTDYTIITEPGEATLASELFDVDDTTLTTAESPPDATPDDPLDLTSIGHHVKLADGVVVEVRVDALSGFGESRTYRVNVVVLPRLASLSVRAPGSGPGCNPVCPGLALSPPFERDVFEYSVTAASDVSEVTVSYTAASGTVTVTPEDAAPPLSGHDFVPGHQVAVGGAGAMLWCRRGLRR